jgi:hypothetical protein
MLSPVPMSALINDDNEVQVIGSRDSLLSALPWTFINQI